MAAERTEWRQARAGGLRIVHRADFEPGWVLRAVEGHRVHAAGRQASCEHWSRTSSVSRVVLEQSDGPLELAVKCSHWRGWRGAVGDALRGSRPARAAAGAQRLAELGLAHPEHLAFAERRRGGVVRESFLVMRFVGGPGPLSAALASLRDVAPRRRVLAARLGDLLGALHAAGIDHTDLKHSNLVLGPGDEVALLDLDAVVCGRRLSWGQRVRALGQLEAYAADLHPWLPATDRMRFLRAYLRHAPELRARQRELAREARDWAGRRLTQWAARPRPKSYPLVPRAASPKERGRS